MDIYDVSVVGLGSAGLPIAVSAAQAGLRVVGLDSSPRRIEDIVNGAPGCGQNTVSDKEIAAVLACGYLRLRDAAEAMPVANAHVLCVPAPPGIAGGADLMPLLTVGDRIARVLRRGDLVLVHSDCPLGTVRPVLLHRLVTRSGLAPGAGFRLAYSPVRTFPGRVVAGETPECLEAARRFLADFTDHVVPVSSIDVAELVKVFEGNLRLVTCSLVTELARVCQASRVDFDEVLAAARVNLQCASAVRS